MDYHNSDPDTDNDWDDPFFIKWLRRPILNILYETGLSIIHPTFNGSNTVVVMVVNEGKSKARDCTASVEIIETDDESPQDFDYTAEHGNRRHSYPLYWYKGDKPANRLENDATILPQPTGSNVGVLIAWWHKDGLPRIPCNDATTRLLKAGMWYKLKLTIRREGTWRNEGSFILSLGLKSQDNILCQRE